MNECGKTVLGSQHYGPCKKRHSNIHTGLLHMAHKFNRPNDRNKSNELKSGIW